MNHRGKKGRNHEYQDSNNSASTLAWDHALSLLTLYVSLGKGALFSFPLEPKKQKGKKNNAWSQVTSTPETRTLKGNEKQFELAGNSSIGVNFNEILIRERKFSSG